MNRIKLHPQFLKSNGKDQFVILPFKEYPAIQEALEDAGDLTSLREAREKDDPSARGFTLEEVRTKLGFARRRKSKRTSRKGK